MFDTGFPRDLLMTAAIFGAAAFVWSGMAQERPPRGTGWRVLLGALGIAGLAIVGFAVPHAIRLWESGTALEAGTPAFIAYVVVFWIEVLAILVLAIVFRRTKRMQLLAPTILVIVGVHFVPLAFVFEQPIILVAGVLLTAAGGVVFLLGRRRRAEALSFWCGVLAAPIFLVLGAVCLVAGLGAA